MGGQACSEHAEVEGHEDVRSGQSAPQRCKMSSVAFRQPRSSKTGALMAGWRHSSYLVFMLLQYMYLKLSGDPQQGNKGSRGAGSCWSHSDHPLMNTDGMDGKQLLAFFFLRAFSMNQITLSDQTIRRSVVSLAADLMQDATTFERTSHWQKTLPTGRSCCKCGP